MVKTFAYACAEFPGMEACPAHFHTETRKELDEIVRQHAILAHGENPDDWSQEDRDTLASLVREEG